MKSFGTVAAVFSVLGYPSRHVIIKGKQASVAVRQSLLMQDYPGEFRKYGIFSAQLLLTKIEKDRNTRLFFYFNVACRFKKSFIQGDVYKLKYPLGTRFYLNERN